MADNKKKIHVLVCPSDTYGVGLYRSKRPHEQLQKMFGDEFEVEINMNPNWADFPSFEKYDIIHFHKGLFNDEDLDTAVRHVLLAQHKVNLLSEEKPAPSEEVLADFYSIPAACVSARPTSLLR